ncbi:MAG: helix-turn-helix transcriptional regulator [Thermomicrobiales bacterium]
MGQERMQALWRTGANTPLQEIVGELLRIDSAPPAYPVPSDANGPQFGLTPREIEVLRLVRDGRSNREIGEQLFVSERTAQTHVQHILAKLDVNTRAAAAARAVELEIV